MPRAYKHDYRARCIYHITITKAAGVPVFGHLCGKLPDVSIARTPLGQIIAANIGRIPQLDSHLRVLQYVIMPDHIHLLLFVTAPVPRHLGSYIGMFKVKIGQEFRLLTGVDSPVFEEDFYDCILYKSRSLDTIFKYIRDNPRRLAVRKEFPDYFRRVNSLPVGSRQFQVYGNVQLLENPFKEQVVVHRSEGPDVREANRQRWLHTAANGGVLVSPFISPAEKAIRKEAEALNSKIILITNTPMSERFKPAEGDFALCEKGRLLIVSAPGALTRQKCLEMNSLAGEMAQA
ncbi:MAG: hypothetical protein HDS72_05830 [Bacteroidales bacterium]|nr:hypothetical protein [Bacteroidales bacterium]